MLGALIVPLVSALVVAVMLTPLMRAIAKRSRVLAHPTDDRWHGVPMPLLGGVAIFAATTTVVAATTSLRPLGPLLPLLVCSGLMFALGLADDLRHLRPATKLVGQMLVAAFMLSLSQPITITGVVVVDQLLAFTWVVGITNAFNLLDNIDGLAAGVAAIAGIFYLFVLVPAGALPMITPVAAFVGATLGFLAYNFRPASVFMGDSGSHFIGCFLAGVTLLAAPGFQGQLVQVAAIPFLILLVPIFDTTFVTVTRKLSGRGALAGGRDHTSHRLVRWGFRDHDAVLVLWGLAALGGLVALGVHYLGGGYAVTLVALYVVLLVALGFALGHVQSTDTSNASEHDLGPAPLVSELTYRHRAYEVVLDIALIAIAYFAAFSIRFAEPESSQFLSYFAASFPVVLGTQLAGLWWVGKYRRVSSAIGSAELVTSLNGVVVGVASSVLLLLYLYRFEGFSRWVFVTDGAVLTFLLVGSRVSITQIDEYLRRHRTRGRAALIYGAGKGGLLLARELLENDDRDLLPLGFVDDDPLKRRWRVEGVPVLGCTSDLSALLRRHDVVELVIAIRDLPSERLGFIADLCRDHGALSVALVFWIVKARVTVPPAITGSSVNSLLRVRPLILRSSDAAFSVVDTPLTVATTLLVVLV